MRLTVVSLRLRMIGIEWCLEGGDNEAFVLIDSRRVPLSQLPQAALEVLILARLQLNSSSP